jgi:hypothetical protein
MHALARSGSIHNPEFAEQTGTTIANANHMMNPLKLTLHVAIHLALLTLMAPSARSQPGTAPVRSANTSTSSSLPADYLAEITDRSNNPKKDSYYADGQRMRLFNPYPKPNSKKPWSLKYFGPVGIGIHFKAPGMTMEISGVEEGSPADQTGQLKKGQIIESINGKILKDIDPRIILGDIITEAEATDGKIVLKIRDLGDVTMQIPVMGSYSDTWPLNCPKSDRIVRNLADQLAKIDRPLWGSVIFLLSTGEEKDLQVVRRWMKDIKTIGAMNWEKGYKGPGLCEYYLRTGDKSVLPVIKKMTEELKENMYNGGWSGRGKPAAYTYGQLSASGVHCLTFLIMAELCGVDVDDSMFNQVFPKFYRHSGHGNVPYGDMLPEGGLRDNGKTGGLAMALQAATLLSPDGESSIYAKARDNCAMKAFYATNWFHAAHTGGGIGEIWHHTSMNQMREKRPVQYRSYFDTRRWVMELSRRHDGGIAIAGMDDGYNVSATDCKGDLAWGTYFALTYTQPRKQLQLFGAPRSPYAKHLDLPRPWGNEADDAFQGIEPIPGGPLTREDLLNETVVNASSVPYLKKLADPETADELAEKLMYHPEYIWRVKAADYLVRKNKLEKIESLLASDDTRLREVGLVAINGSPKGSALSPSKITGAMFGEVSKMIRDPKEAWWTKYQAVCALEKADKDFIAQHRDLLLTLMEDHPSEFMQTAACETLTEIAFDPEHYQVVLPKVLIKASTFPVYHASAGMMVKIQKALPKASSEVKRFAQPILKEIYVEIPPELREPENGTVLSNAAKTKRWQVSNLLNDVPGGEEFVKHLPRETLKSHLSGREADQFIYDKFKMNEKLVGEWKWEMYLKGEPGEFDDASVTKSLNGYLARNPFWRAKSKSMIFKEDGTVKNPYAKGKWYWSGDMLFGLTSPNARRMHYRVIDGVELLVVEDEFWNTGEIAEGFDKLKAGQQGAEALKPSYRIYFKRNKAGEPAPTTNRY